MNEKVKAALESLQAAQEARERAMWKYYEEMHSYGHVSMETQAKLNLAVQTAKDANDVYIGKLIENGIEVEQ